MLFGHLVSELPHAGAGSEKTVCEAVNDRKNLESNLGHIAPNTTLNAATRRRTELSHAIKIDSQKLVRDQRVGG